MPRIEHIVGEGLELAKSQQQVLDVPVKHPDYVFRMHNDDLTDLQMWVARPEAAEPTRPGADLDHAEV